MTEVVRKKRAYRKKTPFERAEIKLQKQRAAEYEAECLMSVEEWHAYNRGKIAPEELATMLARQEAVWDTMHWLEQNIKGTYNVDVDDECYLGLEEGVADLNTDIAKYGVVYCYGSLYSHSDIFRKSEEFRDIVRRQMGHNLVFGKNASEVYLTTGIMVALPSQQAADFRRMNYITAGGEKPPAPIQQYRGVIRSATKKDSGSRREE